jgi:hypothetical protein
MSRDPADGLIDDPVAILGLDKKQLERRAAAAEACAAYHRAVHGPNVRTATMSVVAASCWAAIDSAASQRWWRSAHEQYADLRHPYAELITVCAGFSGREEIELRPPQNALALQCRLILLAWLSVVASEYAVSYRDGLEHLDAMTAEFAVMCPGQLGLPVRHVHLFARALCSDWGEQGLSPRAANAAEYLLRRAADAVRAAQADRFHWRRILPGFMPVEPEWLAVGRVIYEAAARFSSGLAMVTRFLDPLEQLPLVIAGRMPPPVRVAQGDPKSGPPAKEGRNGAQDGQGQR